MLRLHESTSAAAAVKYHDEGLARDDYYRGKGEVKAKWLGQGAKRLGLEGDVRRKDFVALVNNRDPNTGERLTIRNKKNRRPGYDATLSAWKSASVMNNVYGCTDIRDAFWKAGDEMMTQEAEPEMRTRVRVNGADYDRITGNATIAAYRHSNSRPVDGRSDPHDHTHYYYLNATFDPVENRWKAAQLGDLKAKAPELELEFDYRYARELMDLGYVPVMGKTGVQLKGVPQSVIDKFSRSSKRIDKESAARGITDGIGKHKVADKLRESKKSDLAKGALEADWQSRLTDSEKAALERVKNKEIEPGREITPREARDFAIDHLFQRRDDITERKLRKTMVHYGIGYVSPRQANAEIADALKEGVIRSIDTKKGRVFVKSSTLRDQGKMTRLSREGIGKYEPLAYAYRVHAELSQEQNAVARSIVESRDKYLGFRGPAGTGKSYTLKGVDAAIKERTGEKTFSRALALAPSASASRGELRKAGFRDADTLAAFFTNEKRQAEMRGQFLIVDESGMMSTNDMVRLMDIAEKFDNRVLLVGDWKQHQSVDAGQSFRLLQAEGGLKYAELSENRRQESMQHREAVNSMATGTPEGIVKGFNQLDAQGAVIVEADRERLREKLTAAFLAAKDNGDTALIVTPTHREADYLTQKIRTALRQRGQIRGAEQTIPARRPTNFTDAEKRDSRNYDPGMVVEFHKAVPGIRQSVKGKRDTAGGFKRGEIAVVAKGGNGVTLTRLDGSAAELPAAYADRFQVYRADKQTVATGDQIRITKNGEVKVEGQAVGTRVNNGDVYPIEGWTNEGDMRLPGGKLLPRNYGHIAMGYVSTSQRSQGNTVDREFVDWNSETLKALDRQGAYVTSSRFRKGITYFVDDKEQVKTAMQRGGERKTALELVKEHLGEEKITVRPRFGVLQHLERNRVTRYLKGSFDAVRETGRNLIKGWRNRGGIQYA
jgi:conjugative relaxase-like TrwC/TraI family protein